MSSLQFLLAETHIFGIAIHPWKIVGLSGSLIFGDAFSDSMDRLGTGAEERDSVWLLGMQRAREHFDAELFCDLSARFRGRDHDRAAVADLFAESLFSLHAQASRSIREMSRGRRSSAILHLSAVGLGCRSVIAPEKIIYLDNNATTQLDPAVLEEMLPFLTKYYGNPSGGYRFGVQVREAIELARERVAGLLGCLPTRSCFHERRDGIG